MTVVGVDLGGTKIAAARIGADGGVGEAVRIPTPGADGPQAVLDAVARAVLLASDGEPPTAVGVGTAGAVDVGRGRIISSTETLAGWAGTDVRSELRRRLDGAVVHVTNDVDAHAAGEVWIGAGRGFRTVLVVTVGTGVGGALALDGRIHRGAHHVAGEIGHIPVFGSDARCPCGRPGHLEAVAAGPAILRAFLAAGGRADNLRSVARQADAGHDPAVAVLAAAASVLGATLAGLVTTIDPDVVIVGGGVTRAGRRWWEPMEDRFRSELVEPLREIPLLPPILGDAAALVGAGHEADLLREETHG